MNKENGENSLWKWLLIVVIALFLFFSSGGLEAIQKKDKIVTDSDKNTAKKYKDEKLDDDGNINLEKGKITIENMPEYTGKFDIITINNIDGEHQQTSFTKKELSTATGAKYEENEGQLGGIKVRIKSEDIEDSGTFHIIEKGIMDIPIYSHIFGGKEDYMFRGTTTLYKNLYKVNKDIGEVGKKGDILYQITPVYKEKEKIPRGIQVEAYSLSDKGKSLSINIFLYNVERGEEIDYLTGIIKNY